jgi:hypothetical protein
MPNKTIATAIKERKLSWKAHWDLIFIFNAILPPLVHSPVLVVAIKTSSQRPTTPFHERFPF